MIKNKHNLIGIITVLAFAGVLMFGNNASATVKSKIDGKDARTTAKIKASEMVKIAGEYKGTFDREGLTIEIVGDLKEIDGGVEVYARAWKDGKQLGFGDGTVDIERFKIYNPPILVPDVNGTIAETHTKDNGEVVTRKFREDLVEAVRQTVTHSAKVIGKESNKIVVGKIGKTTSTFYPDAVPSTSVDGRVRRTSEATWADARDNATGDVAEPSASAFSITTTKSGGLYNVFVGFYLFDTSSLNGATVSAAVMSIYQDGGSIANADTTSSSVVETNPATNTNLVVGDFSTRVLTDLGNLALSSWSINAYNDHTLNATGLTKINVAGGITKLGLTTLLDVNNSAPTAANGPDNAIGASTAGTTQDPKLVVTYTGGAAPVSTLPAEEIIFFE